MEYQMGAPLADDGQEKRRKSSVMKTKAVKFTKIVSLVGLRHATDARNSTTRRFIWVAWVLFGVGLAVYQIEERIEYYRKYPSSVKMQVLTETTLQFPQVTICPDNQIIASRARSNKPSLFLPIANVENTMQRLRLYEERHFVKIQVKQAKALLKGYIEDLHNLTPDWFNTSKFLAPNSTETIKFISFNKDENRSIIEEVRNDLGHCFAFGTRRSPLNTTIAGPVNGLILVLSAPRIEIIPNVRYLASAESFPGFRIHIHDPNEIPRMRDSGFSLRPGWITRVTVEFKNETLQGKPHGTCFDKNMTYKTSHCLSLRDEQEFINRCGCRDIYMDSHENVSYCTFGEILNCSHAILIPPNVGRTGDDDRCEKQCHRRVYTTSVTRSKFPQILSDDLKNAGSIDDLLKAIIYFPQLSYYESRSVEDYTELKLLCDVGNALSLLLGATLLTIYEASEFLLVFISDYMRFRFTK